MCAINRKYDENNNIVVRRVLIRYVGKPQVKMGVKYFNSVKLVFADPYFNNEKASHRYNLQDDGYFLLECKNDNLKQVYQKNNLLSEKRKYHIYPGDEYTTLFGNEGSKTIFKAKSDEEAIKIFNDREELR